MPDQLIRPAYLAAALAATIYTAAGLWTLWHGYPAEDAYILFTYVEALAGGEGIVYFPGGPRTEGATDFLWMVALTGLVEVGFDVLFAALFLNACGAFLLTYLLARRATLGTGKLRENLHLLLLVAVILGSRLTGASLAGFSTYFYTAACVLLACMYLDGDRKNLLWLPVVGLVVGLIRPDGVIIGVAFTLLGLHKALHRGWLRPYLIVAIGTAITGAIYFLWRYWYFGLLLPLPLYVKVGDGKVINGLGLNLLWLIDSLFILIAVPFGAQHLRLKGRDYLLVLLPFLALLAALTFTHQSQNIALRFQAPALGMLLLIFGAFLRDMVEPGWLQPKAAFAGALAILAAGVHGLEFPGYRYEVGSVSRLVYPGYADVFAHRLDEVVDPTTTIALTEAGRLAFWTDARTYDLIGLNTPEIVQEGMDITYLKNLEPDLIMVHTIDTLSIPEELNERTNVLETDIGTILSWVRYDVNSTKAKQLRTRHTSLQVYQFLRENAGLYKILLVRYNGLLQHLYAIRVGRIDAAAVVERLRWSTKPENFSGYIPMRFGITKRE